MFEYVSRIETRFSRDKRNDDSFPNDEVVGEFEKVRSLGATSSRSISQEEKRQIH